MRDDGESGIALILVDASGENVIVVAPGANAPSHARRTSASARRDAVMCQREIPDEAVRAAAAGARSSA